jgi:hypothetical protein
MGKMTVLMDLMKDNALMFVTLHQRYLQKWCHATLHAIPSVVGAVQLTFSVNTQGAVYLYQRYVTATATVSIPQMKNVLYVHTKAVSRYTIIHLKWMQTNLRLCAYHTLRGTTLTNMSGRTYGMNNTSQRFPFIKSVMGSWTAQLGMMNYLTVMNCPSFLQSGVH